MTGSIFRIGCDQVCRTADAILADGEVPDGNVEPVLMGDGQVAAESGRSPFGIRYLHGYGLRAVREDLAEGEASFRVHRHLQPQGLDGLTGEKARAIDCNGTAGNGDIGQGPGVLAPACHPLPFRSIGIIVGARAVQQSQGFGRRLVEAALSVIDAKQIEQLIRCIRRRGPGNRTLPARRDHGQRTLL